MLIPGLAGHNAISPKRFQTAQSTKVQALQCGTDLDQLCDICIEYADDYINVMLSLIYSECQKSVWTPHVVTPHLVASYIRRFDRPGPVVASPFVIIRTAVLVIVKFGMD